MEYINSDITNETSGLIIHGVNCMGVMGSGVALAIKTKWPIVYEEYVNHKQGKSQLGEIQIVHINDNLYVGNCWTQWKYGRDSAVYADKTAIKACLLKTFEYCFNHDLILKSPKIGAGLGGLNWEEDVGPIFDFCELLYPDVTVQIFSI